MRKYILTILVVLFVSILSVDINAGLVSGNTIITKEEIRQSGLMRLSDLFLIINDWDFSTIDGITYNASPFGLNSYQHQEWKIFLNGNPIDIGFFGTKALDRIPIDLSQIESIRIENHASVYAGQKTTGGLIDIYTKRYDSGLAINFRTGFGNEIGDPGPYRNTELSSPNIDKIGNVIATNISYSSKKYYHNFGYKREIGYPTDEAMFQRNNDIAQSYYPRLILESYYIDYGKTFNNFNYSISTAQSEFADFFFLRQYGREISVNSKFRYIAGNCLFGTTEKPSITCRFVYSSNKLGKRENSLNLDFDWHQENIRTNIETYFSKPKLNGTIGIGLNHFSVSTGYIMDETKNTEGIFYGQLKYLISKRINTTIDWTLNHKKGKTGFLALSKIDILLGENTLLTSAISYSRTFPEESNSIWYWQKQGYTFLEDNGIIYDIKGQIKPSKKITLDISIAKRISRLLSLELSGFFRSFSQIYCEGQYLISPTDYSAPNNLMVKTDCSGQIVGAGIQTRIKPFSKFKIILSGRYQSTISDDILFEENWNTISKITLSGSIIYKPIRNFSLLGRIRYNGSTKWVDYDNTDNILTGDHNSFTVDEIFTIDFTAQKYFQKRKIRTSFSIRNLFNRELRYIPIGAKFDLSYFAQIEFLLN